jgi:hypothetical protein
MEQMSCGFDEARLIRTNRIFKKNGIDEHGFPLGESRLFLLHHWIRD